MSNFESGVYPSSFHVMTEDGVKLSCRSFGQIILRKNTENSTKCNIVFVMVHPYGIMGGSSSNMLGLALSLADKGYSSIIFDHRGVGKSSGTKSLFGNSEVLDVIAVCKDVKKKSRDLNVVLIGSSAGAPIAGSAVDLCENVIGYVGIGYVFGFWPSLLFKQHYEKILDSNKPKLFIMGQADGFTSLETLNYKMNKCKEPKFIKIIPNVGHFELESPRYDDHISDIIEEFVNKSFLS